MSKKSISVRVHVSLEDLESILYGAYEGTGYWAKDKRDKEDYQVGIALLCYEDSMKDFIAGDLQIYIHDTEDNDKQYILTIAKIKRGLTCMAKKFPKHFADIMTENTDIYTADVLVQCALFNDIIYS